MTAKGADLRSTKASGSATLRWRDLPWRCAGLCLLAGVGTSSLTWVVEAGAASATVQIAANVLVPNQVDVTQALAFGDLVPGSGAGTAVVGTGGAVTTTGGVEALAGSAANQAILVVSGNPNRFYTLLLPNSATLTGQHTGQTIRLDTITSNPTPGFHFFPPGLPPVHVTYDIGGTLHLNGNQTADLYTGTLIVTVNFN